MRIEPAALLGLISDLAESLYQSQEESAKLRHALDAAQEENAQLRRAADERSPVGDRGSCR